MASKLQLAVGVGAAVIGAYLAGRSSSDTKEQCPYLKRRGAEKKASDLLEFSVVYTDRATNLMSNKFVEAMVDIGTTLKQVYNADSLALIPGSGSFAMEAAARQYGRGKKCLVIRNGYFSFRWSDIFDQSGLPSEEVVIMANAQDETPQPKFAPPSIEEVVASILSEKPAAVFAPHVETSTGIILNDEYIKKVADAVHQVGGVFVLDCIASGCIWVDMKALGIDVVISAPQKGWSGPACVGIVMMNQRARDIAANAELNAAGSMACNLKKWSEVMDKYMGGGFMYYTTLPTDALLAFRNVILETTEYGFAKAKADQYELGRQIRGVLEKHGYPSVAADNVKSPGVVVSYAPDATMVGKFKGQGLQIAGGVPFKINEPAGLLTFRVGLFGLDKIGDISKTVATFENALVAMK